MGSAFLLLNEKRVEFDVTYIDLKNKPDWFLRISPLGKVPVLKVGETVLFESAVICEYLDEVHPPTLHPGRSSGEGGQPGMDRILLRALRGSVPSLHGPLRPLRL